MLLRINDFLQWLSKKPRRRDFLEYALICLMAVGGAWGLEYFIFSEVLPAPWSIVPAGIIAFVMIILSLLHFGFSLFYSMLIALGSIWIIIAIWLPLSIELTEKARWSLAILGFAASFLPFCREMDEYRVKPMP